MADKAISVPGVFFTQELGGIREYRLGSNDLQILIAPDHAVPVVGVMVTYRVGSRNEAGRTYGRNASFGASHVQGLGPFQ